MNILSKNGFHYFFGNRAHSCPPTITKQESLEEIGHYPPFSTLLRAFGANQIILPRQTHGTAIIEVNDSTAAKKYLHNFYEADAVITAMPQIIIGVLTADCLPIIMIDHIGRVAAVIHAGWRGSVAHIAETVAQKLNNDYNASFDSIQVYFGPCIHQTSYPASPELLAALKDDPLKSKVLSSPSNHFDLPGFNQLQLENLGIPSAHIHRDACVDTFANPHFCSYRRDGERAERQLSLVMIDR